VPNLETDDIFGDAMNDLRHSIVITFLVCLAACSNDTPPKAANAAAASIGDPAAPETAPRLLYYQGSAKGGNYMVLLRTPCARDEEGIVNCPVKVKDDRVEALGTGFDVTDTFHLTFEEGTLVKVTTSSNDQDIYREAAVWVRENMPKVMKGPCANRNTPEGTPVECSRAMTAGYKAFVASPDFPGVPPLPEVD